MTFNNLIQMIVKIREIALFTRATPGSSLVCYKSAHHYLRSPHRLCCNAKQSGVKCKKMFVY